MFFYFEDQNELYCCRLFWKIIYLYRLSFDTRRRKGLEEVKSKNQDLSLLQGVKKNWEPHM